jgi:hypothetical protein
VLRVEAEVRLRTLGLAVLLLVVVLLRLAARRAVEMALREVVVGAAGHSSRSCFIG